MANLHSAQRHLSVRRNGFSVSPRLAKLNEEFTKSGGKWERISMGTLFDVSSSKMKFDANKISFGGKYRYVVRTSQNNGIKGYIDEDTAFLNDGQTISFGQDTATIFYQDLPYFTGDKIKILTLLNGYLNNRSACYLLGAMRKAFANFQWGVDSFNEDILKEICVCVPMSQGEVDFNFMEEYIGLLKSEYVTIINSFLEKYSLEDYALTGAEEAALHRLLRGEVSWRPYVMNEVFAPLKAPYLRKGTRRQDHVSRIRTKEFCLPVVCAKRGNNGIMKFGRREDFTAHSNVLSIIYNGAIAAGLVYAHEEEVGIFTDSYLIKWMGEDIPFDANLFLKTAIQKKIYPIYSREQKATWKNRVEAEEIYLPTDSDGEIDVEFMQTIVRAEKKMAARKVIAYINDIAKEMTANKVQAIKPHCTTIPLHPSLAYNPMEFGPMMAAEPFECYKWEGFDQSICNFFGGDKTILIGCYKGKKYEDWIHTHNIYTIRLGDTKGSMEANRELFDGTSLLVLYELGKPNKLSTYKIVGNKEMGKEELLAMDYPNKKPRKSYMTFSITPLEMDLTFLVEHHLIERLIELNSENAKGTPVFIQP